LQIELYPRERAFSAKTFSYSYLGRCPRLQMNRAFSAKHAHGALGVDMESQMKRRADLRTGPETDIGAHLDMDCAGRAKRRRRFGGWRGIAKENDELI
jgi:hypothetical protein